MTPLSPLGSAALTYAAQGLAVFPLAPMSKKPLFPKEIGGNGFRDATTDAATITQWWTDHPTANIGGVPASAGLVALDIDSPACWSLATSLGLLAEPTHQVTTGLSTPSAETCHLYFRHPAPDRDTPLADTIIVRGRNGYVVLPPSIHPVTRQAYTTETTLADAIPLPDRAAMMLMAQQSNAATKVRTAALTEATTVTPGGRHAALVAVAGTLAAHGMLSGDGLAMLQGYNLRACTPPKDSAEVEAIWDYVTTRETAKRAERDAVRAAVDLTALLETPAAPPAPLRTMLRVSELMQELPTIPFLIDQLLPEQGLAVLWAPAGSGKTFTTLDMALHVASGQPWQGRAVRQVPVLWVVGEGFLGMRARVAAWCTETGTDPSVLEDWFVVRRLAWDLTDQASRYDVLLELDSMDLRPSLVVIDTLSSNGPPGFDDSNTKDMKMLMDAARIIRDAYPATVLFTHHSGHDTSRMRGSTDAIGAVDVSFKLTPSSGGLVTFSVEKARDFMKPDAIPLRLVPAHGAQVVRAADPIDLTALIATVKPSHVAILTAVADAGRALRPAELATASGLGKYAYEAIAECLAQQFLIVHQVASSKSYTLSEAGTGVVRAHRPTPVVQLVRSENGQTDQNLTTDQPATFAGA